MMMLPFIYGTCCSTQPIVVLLIACLANASLHLREPLEQTLSVSGATSIYSRGANKDRVLDLPGLDYDPGFNQFSGYLTVSKEHGRNIFYWYVESQNDPKNDPVVFWTNGGPGCSGFVGFGTEHGPYFIAKDGKLSPNPYSWNKIASILYVEQPAGVGFSYSDTKGDYETGDAKAANDNYVLIREFLKRFPERQGNEFYIASESYGGHYIPQLAKEILSRNNDGLIKFCGFMVGNPYVDPFTNKVTQFESYYAHGPLAKPLFDKWAKACSNQPAYDENTCSDLESQMFAEFGRGINPYALDYPVCTDVDKSQGRIVSHESLQLTRKIQGRPPFLPDEDIYHPCEADHLEKYLNRWDVQVAIHANPGRQWAPCSSDIQYSERDIATPQVDLYRELVAMAIKGQHRLNMLVFSGDDDAICSTAGTQEWIYDLGVDPMVGHLWKSWTVNKQTAGFVTHFNLGDDANATFTFATVHGAGHEVPAYRPMEALQLFKTYLRGEWQTHC